MHQYIEGWEKVKSLEDVEISLPGGFTGTTYVAKNKHEKIGETNPIIIKLYDHEKRPGLDKEMQFAKILSDDKFGPHIYYQCDLFRVEKYYNISLLGIFEMRNPHY